MISPVFDARRCTASNRLLDDRQHSQRRSRPPESERPPRRRPERGAEPRLSHLTWWARCCTSADTGHRLRRDVVRTFCTGSSARLQRAVRRSCGRRSAPSSLRLTPEPDGGQRPPARKLITNTADPSRRPPHDQARTVDCRPGRHPAANDHPNADPARVNGAPTSRRSAIEQATIDPHQPGAVQQLSG
jgi:hypothetical protein